MSKTEEVVKYLLEKKEKVVATEIAEDLGISTNDVMNRVHSVNFNSRKWKGFNIISHNPWKGKSFGSLSYELIAKNTKVRPCMDNVNAHAKKGMRQFVVGLIDQYSATTKTDEGKENLAILAKEAMTTSNKVMETIQEVRIKQLE